AVAGSRRRPGAGARGRADHGHGGLPLARTDPAQRRGGRPLGHVQFGGDVLRPVDGRPAVRGGQGDSEVVVAPGGGPAPGAVGPRGGGRPRAGGGGGAGAGGGGGPFPRVVGEARGGRPRRSGGGGDARAVGAPPFRRAGRAPSRRASHVGRERADARPTAAVA